MIPGVFAGVPCGDECGGGERGAGRHDGAERVPRRPGGLLLMNKPYTLHPTPYTLNPSPYTLHPKPYTERVQRRPGGPLHKDIACTYIHTCTHPKP